MAAHSHFSVFVFIKKDDDDTDNDDNNDDGGALVAYALECFTLKSYNFGYNFLWMLTGERAVAFGYAWMCVYACLLI